MEHCITANARSMRCRGGPPVVAAFAGTTAAIVFRTKYASIPAAYKETMELMNLPNTNRATTHIHNPTYL